MPLIYVFNYNHKTAEYRHVSYTQPLKILDSEKKKSRRKKKKVGNRFSLRCRLLVYFTDFVTFVSCEFLLLCSTQYYHSSIFQNRKKERERKKKQLAVMMELSQPEINSFVRTRQQVPVAN